MNQILNYIDGQLAKPLSADWLDVSEPAVGAVYASVADSGSDDVAVAIDAAQRAAVGWSRTEPEERAAWLHRIADRIEQHLEDLALDESRDTGKPLSLARSVDIPRAARNFRFFAAAAVTFASQSHAGVQGTSYTLRQPLGVVGCISPWNLPLYLFSWKVAPALAAGNCVVGKPSEVTPLTAMRLGELCIEAGLPAGVLNIVQGRGDRAGRSLVRHPDIKAVSFTGGSATGRIASDVASQFKKLSLEMGGKNPNIVFADCNLERALEATLRAAFANQGQICLCGSRLLIQRPLYERFRDALVERAATLRVGDPLEPNTDLGAIVSAEHLAKISRCVDDARSAGGKILHGGRPTRLPGRCRDGWFYQPTIIEGLDNDCPTNQDEIFGPVVCLIPFDTIDDAIAKANDSKYGLSASIWTADLHTAHRVARDIDVGIVWINSWLARDLRTPFGGRKASGMGREGGWEAMRFFTDPKNVYVDYGVDGLQPPSTGGDMG